MSIAATATTASAAADSHRGLPDYVRRSPTGFYRSLNPATKLALAGLEVAAAFLVPGGVGPGVVLAVLVTVALASKTLRDTLRIGLAALPLVTAGYYSKDLIISTSLGSVDGSAWLWAGAVAGALLTGIYSFRLVFVVFFGEQHTPVTRRPRWRMQTPLVVLAVLSVIGGFVWLPDWMGGWKPVEHFLSTALPATDAGGWAFGLGEATIVEIVSLSGIGIAYLLWIRRRDATAVFAARPAPDALERYWRAGWGFDVLYEYVFVVPVKWFAHLARNDLVEPVVKGIAGVNVLAWRGLSASQNGLLRLYIAVAGAGLAVIIAVVVLR